MRPILSDLFNSKVKEPAIRPKFLVLLVPTLRVLGTAI